VITIKTTFSKQLKSMISILSMEGLGGFILGATGAAIAANIIVMSIYRRKQIGPTFIWKLRLVYSTNILWQISSVLFLYTPISSPYWKYFGILRFSFGSVFATANATFNLS
jgi:hypothetical protein